MPQVLKTPLLLVLPFLALSCNPVQENTDHHQGLTNSDDLLKAVLELTPEQESAFEALTFLQTNTDELNRLYSSFPNIDHPCFPADTSFTITQLELLTAMMQFVTMHCSNLPIEERDSLAKASVLAEEKYKVLHCKDHLHDENYENGLPLNGTWVLPGILGRTDLTLVW